MARGDPNKKPVIFGPGQTQMGEYTGTGNAWNDPNIQHGQYQWRKGGYDLHQYKSDRWEMGKNKYHVGEEGWWA